MFGKMIRRRENVPEVVDAHAVVAPLIDIFESDKNYLMVVELPGVVDRDLKIDYNRGTLTLHASRDVKKLGDPIVTEATHINYHRVFTVPEEIDADLIKGELKNGLLHLTLPKISSAKHRQIPIAVS